MATKKKKKEDEKRVDRVDMDVRPFPNPIFENYDLYGPSEGGEVSSGTGLYDCMNKGECESVDEFLFEKARKRPHSAHKRKKAFMYIIRLIARGEAGGELIDK